MIPPRIRDLFDKAVITFYPQMIRFENRTNKEKVDLVYIVLNLTSRTWEVYCAWDWENTNGPEYWNNQREWAEEYFSEKYDLSKFKLIRL